MITGELKNKIDGIWKIFFSSGITNAMTIIDQVTYLLYIKMLDDTELRKEANAAAFDMEVVDPIFDKEHQNCRWHIFCHYEPQLMFDNMTNNVFPYVKNELKPSKDTAFSAFMKDSLFLLPSAHALVRAVDAINALNTNDREAMSEVYDYILNGITQSGATGLFITPRHIVDMMVQMMKPTIADTICDPAMGSGGFISGCIDYINKHYAADLLISNNRKHYTTEMFSGFDIDPAMARIGAMNIFLKGVESPTIECFDSISEDNTYRDQYSLIFANPPFNGSIDSETISKDLSAIAPTQKTELLFLPLFLKSLMVGGRCICIVPSGILFGSSNAHKAIRKEIIENNRLEAVISLPSGVFKPNTGVTTAILIFTKTGNGGTDNVWFYDMRADGFTLDDKRVPFGGSDIPDIIERFANLDNERERTRTEQSFFVTREELAENGYDLSFNRYRIVEGDGTSHRAVAEIIADMKDEHLIAASKFNAAQENIEVGNEMDKQNYQIYKFENIAINSNAKRMPTDADMETYIGLEHLDSGSLKVSRWGSATPIKGEKLIMQKGDVLFGKRNAYLRRTAIAPHDGLFSAHGMILRPKTNVIIPELFPHFLSSTPFYDAAIRISVGSTSPTINWRDLKELTFPVPPISEQKKIADALWAIEDALNAYRTLLASTDELVKSQFVEMFYDKGYPVKTIGDVIAKKIDRVAKVFEKEDTIQYLDISSIDNSSKTVTGLTTYSLAEAPSRAQYVLKQGDILYSTVRPNLQNIAINPYSDNNVVGSTGFCVLRCTGVTTGYMWGVINSTPFVDAMINQAYGANYPAVTDKVVHAYEIPIPPVQAQKAYEELVEQSDKSKFEIQNAIDQLELLKKALMHKYFG